MSGKPPFHDIIDAAVIYQVGVRHMRPERPSEGWCPDHMWNLVELCWGEDPPRRPTAKSLQRYLRRLLDAGSPSPEDPSFTGYFPGNREDSPPHASTSDSDPPEDDAHSRPSNLPHLSPSMRLTENMRNSPPSPTMARYIAQFFQENEGEIADAVISTSFSSPSLQRCVNDDKQFLRIAGDALRKGSAIFNEALDVLSGVHPAIGGGRGFGVDFRYCCANLVFSSHRDCLQDEYRIISPRTCFSCSDEVDDQNSGNNGHASEV